MDAPTPGQSEKSKMNVIEVRRNLNEMRKLWRTSGPEAPFYSSHLFNDSQLSIAEFSFRFVQSHHRQRPARMRNAAHALSTAAQKS